MPDSPDKSILRTSHTLLERVRDQSDEQSWKEFINYYDQYIYNILRYKNVPAADADELCQEIILKLWKKMPEFVYNRDRGKFRSWLGRIIWNDVSTYFTNQKRKEKAISSGEHNLEHKEDTSDDNDIDAIINSEWNNYLSDLAWESIKKRFEENTQKAFLLHIEGKSAKEIAEDCDIKVNTVYRHIQRVEIHLKEEIKKLNEELL